MNGDFKKYRTIAEIIEQTAYKEEILEQDIFLEDCQKCCDICENFCNAY